MTKTAVGTPDPDEDPKRRLTPREHFAAMAEAAHGAIAHKIDAHADARLERTLDRFEADLAPLIAPFVADLLDHPDVPDEVKSLLSVASDPEHFSQSIVIGIALGALVSPVLGTAVQPFIQVLNNLQWPKLPVVPLTPTLLAAAQIKNVLGGINPHAEAAMSGIDADRYDVMYNAAGNSVGPMEALDLWNRGAIDETEVDRILGYSNIRPDFFADIKALRYTIPSLGQIVQGVLKGHLDPNLGRTMAQATGWELRNFDWLVASAGRPYGTHEALDLLNRGVIDEARVREVIRQSDVNPTFTDDILALRVYLPPPRSVVPMLRNGAITEDRARTLLEHHGLSVEDANAFIAEAHHSTASTAKELSAAQVVRMYEAQLIDRATAHARIVALKYPPGDADLYLNLADEQRTELLQRAAVGRIRARFVAHKIDAAAARADLATIQVAPAAITTFIAFWTEERATITPVLTLAQLQGALHRQIIDLTHFVAAVHNLGYTGIDVKIVAAEAFPPTKVPPEVLALVPANL